jgi:hypothetical protein
MVYRALCSHEEAWPQGATEVIGTHHLDRNVTSSGKCAVACRRLRGLSHYLWRKLPIERASTRKLKTEHRKVQATVKRALEFFKRGQKSLIFCVYIKTAETICDQLPVAIDKYLGQIREDVFGNATVAPKTPSAVRQVPRVGSLVPSTVPHLNRSFRTFKHTKPKY